MSPRVERKGRSPALVSENYYWSRIVAEFETQLTDLRNGLFEPNPGDETDRNRRKIRSGLICPL